ncbi:response regulator [uncultured Mucilaginibacter sp.]|uniref:response regulator n=1 Tax=uncultured Mucilaginibacter sp. TaxID=797541 RepID=UPI0025CFA110|nr:response regulator [uncultured Mucilaginibacter sp.]
MYKALVIDDDPIFQYIAEKIFNKTNLFEETNCFLDGNLALEFLEKNGDDAASLPDAIFLDIYMPALSGWEFLNSFDKISSSLKKNIPIYLLTSSIDPKEIQRSREHPAVRAFSSKPVTQEFIEHAYKDCDQVHRQSA